MKIVLCFNCGEPISEKSGTQTAEHIPILSLFKDLGDDFKLNRITVPCCYECNNSSSKTLDEEFRNAIALLSDSPRLTGPAVRSILKYKKEFDRVSLDEIRGIYQRHRGKHNKV